MDKKHVSFFVMETFLDKKMDIPQKTHWDDSGEDVGLSCTY